MGNEPRRGGPRLSPTEIRPDPDITQRLGSKSSGPASQPSQHPASLYENHPNPPLPPPGSLPPLSPPQLYLAELEAELSLSPPGTFPPPPPGNFASLSPQETSPPLPPGEGRGDGMNVGADLGVRPT